MASFPGAKESFKRLDGLLKQYDAEPDGIQRIPLRATCGWITWLPQRRSKPTDCSRYQPHSLHRYSHGGVGAIRQRKVNLARVLLGVWPVVSGAVWWGERPLAPGRLKNGALRWVTSHRTWNFSMEPWQTTSPGWVKSILSW